MKYNYINHFLDPTTLLHIVFPHRRWSDLPDPKSYG